MTPELTQQLTRQLMAWLASTDIGALELRGPGVHLCLHQAGGSVEVLSAAGFSALCEAARHDTATIQIKASAVGIFLHAHPMHEAPLAAPGTAVLAGQAIGLLRVGMLLLPVAAPQAGTMARYAAAPGARVGYGSHLADLIPSTPATAQAQHGH